MTVIYYLYQINKFKKDVMKIFYMYKINFVFYLKSQ